MEVKNFILFSTSMFKEFIELLFSVNGKVNEKNNLTKCIEMVLYKEADWLSHVI